MAYDARTLSQTAVFNSSPDAEESGIWQSDNGAAADAEGNVFVATGNGRFDAASGGRDYGDSLLKLGLAGRGLVLRDYFTPYNEKALNSEDADLGSGGPVLLPDQPGSHPRLALVGGKDGKLYVLDRDRLGKFNPAGNTVAVRVFSMLGGVYAAPAYWNGHVYVLATNDYLKDFALVRGQLSEAPVAIGTRRFGNPGATPAISANGSRDGSSRPRPGTEPTVPQCSTRSMRPTSRTRSTTASRTALGTAQD